MMLTQFCRHVLEVSPRFYSRSFTRYLSVSNVEVSQNNPQKTDVNENSEETLEEVEESNRYSEEDIQQKRNKSRLRSHHRNILHCKPPILESYFSFYDDVKYKRKMYAKYGDASCIDPGICWPTREEMALMKEYEIVSRPLSIQEMVQASNEKKRAEKEAIRLREEEIAAKVAKLDKWKDEYNARIHKAEEEALAAKAKRDRLVEEVRRHFGYKIDPRDERFKEMLAKKEKEEKKLAKEARKKAKEAKILAQLTNEAMFETSASQQHSSQTEATPKTST